MRYFISILALIMFSTALYSQTEGKWLRAFPITDYIVELDDSTRVVQLEMPEGFRIPDKQLAIAYGTYRNSPADAVNKGYGRCQLVKGLYHYFSIGLNKSKVPLQGGDLLYMHLDSTNIHFGRIPKLASHFIRFQNIYENPFYDRYLVFNKWNLADEENLLDSMLTDIHFTGQWLKENNPDQNQSVSSGRYEGKTIFDVMIGCRREDLLSFLDFVIEYPRNYAGGTWKLTETFATWVSRKPL